MKRADILNIIEDENNEGQNDALADVVNHWESKFQEIRDLLSGVTIDNLHDIEKAKDVADDEAANLY